MGVSQFIVLDLTKVGSREGVNTSLLSKMLRGVKANFFVGGGVRDIEDLQNNYVSLKTKLDFLSGSGLKLFVSTTDNARKLRNDIAHFKIRLENGKILLRNKPVHEIISINQRKIVNCINRTNWVLFLLAVELDIASAVELLPKDDKRKLRKNV